MNEETGASTSRPPGRVYFRYAPFPATQRSGLAQSQRSGFVTASMGSGFVAPERAEHTMPGGHADLGMHNLTKGWIWWNPKALSTNKGAVRAQEEPPVSGVGIASRLLRGAE